MTNSSTTAMSKKYHNLLLWARANGAVISENIIFPSEPYGHCQSTIPIPPGTQLFHIPHSLLITPAVATAALPQLKGYLVHARLCSLIATERRKQGFWKDYLDSLPVTFTTPAYFNEEELEVLRGTNLSFAYHDRIDAWRNEFENVKDKVPDLIWDDYLWAATVLSSRSFPSRLITADLTIRSQAPSEFELSDPILIPVMDMLNHKPNQPVTWLTSSNAITFVAETEYPANTEIFNNYGAKGNEERISSPKFKANIVLMGYGFCLLDNPHDSVSLKLPGDTTLYSITHDNLVPEQLLARFCEATRNLREQSLQRRTRRNLYAGYHALLNAIRSKLNSLGFEARRVDTPAGREAQIYRDGQRKLLLAAHTRISQLMQSVVDDGGLYSWKERQGQRIEAEHPSKKVKKGNDLEKSNDYMVEWLATVVTPLERDEGSDPGDEKLRDYLRDLILYYRLALAKGDIGMDEENVLDCRRIKKRLKKRGMEVSIDDITVAISIWEQETVDIVFYGDVARAYEEYCNDGDKSMMEFRSNYERPISDIGLLKDEIPSAS